MSTQPVPVPAPVPAPEPPAAPEQELETFGERMLRKSRQEPLIPVGMALTVFALTGAIVQSRRRNAASMNHWLRARIVAQGLTVAIVVAYAYRVLPRGPDRPPAAAAAADAEGERRAFGRRLQAAEEEHAALERARAAAAGPAGEGARLASAAPAPAAQPAQEAKKGGWTGWFWGR